MRRFFLSIFRFYIEASIHVSLAVYALLKVFLLKNALESDFYLSGTIFFGAITGYNFVKYAPVAKLHHRSLTRFFKGIQFFSLFSFIGLVYCAFKLPMYTLLVLAFGGFFVFLYAIPVVLKQNLRSFSGVKIYVVALSWVLTVVVVPAIHYSLPIDLVFFTHAIQVFVFVVALIIPFDIRDLNYDDKKLQTLPQVIGIANAKLVGAILMILFFVAELMISKKPDAIVATGLMSILTIFFIYKTSVTNSKFYCSFYVESVPLVFWLLLLVV